MPSRLIQKADAVDPEARLRDLINKAEPRLAALYTVLIQNLRTQFTLDELILLLEQGRTDELLVAVERSALRFSSESQAIFIATGMNTAGFLSTAMDKLIVFDGANEFALQAFRQNNLQLIQQFTADMREATRIAITEGITQGFNPRQQARNFRRSIGLTSRQVEAINNYRNLLNQGSLEALNRGLRDKRFDSTVRRSASTGTPLTQPQIDKMVERYSAKQLKWRSEMIARTEALRSVHEGSQEMYRQAIVNGDLLPSQLEQEWHISGVRTRDSHVAMNGQIQQYGTPFLSGLGNQLRFPGDPNVSAADVVNCRCALSTRITNIVI